MLGLFGRTRLKVECSSICGCGLARKDNQDSVFADAAGALFCVADGMGGADCGALASRIVCEEMSRVRLVDDHEEHVMSADRAITAAHGRIRAYMAANGLDRMGTTVAALLLRLQAPYKAAIVYAGDSRVYRRRGVKFKRMTADHRVSAYSHLLTRAVGAGDDARQEWLEASLCKGDVWLLCSDGVHEMLPDSTINALLARGGSAAEMAARIEQAVLKAGARDNYSIVIVKT